MITINGLFTHLHANDDWDLIRLLLNGVICTAIAGIFMFSRASVDGQPWPSFAELRSWFGLLASRAWGELAKRLSIALRAFVVVAVRYTLACVYTYLAWRVWTGHYLMPVDPGELIANVAMLAIAMSVRGDVGIAIATGIELRKKRQMVRAAKHHTWIHRK